MKRKDRAALIALLPIIIVFLAISAMLFDGIALAGPASRTSLAKAPSEPQMQESEPGWIVLTVPDAQLTDRFGYTAAIDGDTLVAGAPGGTAMPVVEEEMASGDSYAGSTPGAVYVFQRQGETWSEGVRLTASDAEAGDQFGLRVALSGDTLAVEARSADLAGERNAGAVYVYQRQGGDWSLQARLAPDDAAGLDYFGEDLVLVEDTLLVGAPGHDERADGDNFGAVYRFQRRGDAWRQAGWLNAPDLGPNSQFGSALALDERLGRLVVYAQTEGPALELEYEQDVEAYSAIVNYVGSVYVFERRGADWRYQDRLTPDQRPYIPFYFIRVGRVAAGGTSAASGEVVVLSLGFYGTFIFQRQGDGWVELSAPELLYQATGVHSLPTLLAAQGERLVFGSVGLSEPGGALLLVELDEWGEIE